MLLKYSPLWVLLLMFGFNSTSATAGPECTNYTVKNMFRYGRLEDPGIRPENSPCNKRPATHKNVVKANKPASKKQSCWSKTWRNMWYYGALRAPEDSPNGPTCAGTAAKNVWYHGTPSVPKIKTVKKLTPPEKSIKTAKVETKPKPEAANRPSAAMKPDAEVKKIPVESEVSAAKPQVAPETAKEPKMAAKPAPSGSLEVAPETNVRNFPHPESNFADNGPGVSEGPDENSGLMPSEPPAYPKMRAIPEGSAPELPGVKVDRHVDKEVIVTPGRTVTKRMRTTVTKTREVTVSVDPPTGIKKPKGK